MSILIRDQGFVAEDWPHGFTSDPNGIGCEQGAGLVLTSDADVSTLHGLCRDAVMIKVVFDNFADGRVFSLARQLRLMGYKGRLRLAGPLLADQYTMARRVGFDEVEVSDAHARRQPEESWLFRADWRKHDYQARLRGQRHTR